MSALPDLSIDDFAAFCKAVHGYQPFPWQARLARQVAAGEPWPRWLTLPTACGKTGVIDIAVFALALHAGQPARTRSAPRRILFIVDRRIVVDQAADHARKLARALAGAEAGVSLAVAQRLRSLGGGPSPLDVHQLRGGMYRDDAWVRSPLQPAVIASTVDQVGSRLLFRGYGLRGGSMWPVHAGLVANDALLVLDEAHCSNPFLQTLDAVARYRRQAEMPLELPFQYSVMSATPPSKAESTFGLNADDQRHHVLQARLNASKRTRLLSGPKTRSRKGEKEFVETIVNEAVALVSDDRVAIGVIVNRVRTAKLVAEAIQARNAGLVRLLTGRTRPVDADEIRDQLSPLETGRRTLGAQTTFVVATQTLEVGADLDFDGLVTECASLDALRQRFGRLNRSGRALDARGVIIVRGEYAEATKDDDADPVYGLSLTQTWKWLNSVVDASGEVDFGFNAMRRERSDRPAHALEMQLADAGVMLPGHVERWAQTSPVPSPDPDVTVFLHGPAREDVDIQVCWRVDLAVSLNDDEQAAVDTVALCPPTSRECMPVPLRVFRRWLAGQEVAGGIAEDIADIQERTGETDEEGSAEAGAETGAARMRWCVRWRGVEAGRDASTIVRADSAKVLRPGETVVVPASLGGWTVFGHVMRPPDEGGDYGEETNATQRRRALLRLTPAVVDAWQSSVARALALEWMNAAARNEDDIDPRTDETLRNLLRTIEDDPDEPTWRKLVARTLRVHARARKLIRYPAAGRASNGPPLGWVLTTYRRIPLDDLRAIQRDESVVFSDEDDGAVATVEVSLRSHLDGVARWASQFAQAVGLPDDLVADVETAARLHDIGKADRRFQAMLLGGNRWLAATVELLAKSGGAPRSVAERRRIRDECGYPDGGRHELLSVRLAEQAQALLAGRDRDLVLHLIASHHGDCRPFAPAVIDSIETQPSMAHARVARVEFDGCSLEAAVVTGLERLDSGIATRFWILNRRYGWWGLAFLEALLRVADWCRSEEEQDLDERPSGKGAA
jgi:CRISPR-associated endonuclease/helicase Cas3